MDQGAKKSAKQGGNMPSREEIVQALKIAAVSCGVFGEHSKAKGLKDLAAQVSAMRCETCKWWDNSPWQVSPETRLCLFPEKRGNAESWSGMTECGPKFGCFHHEPK